MAAQMQPPNLPTPLLWAHQMKREHSFLLTRMQKLEAAISRIEAIAVASQKEIEIADIAQQVQTLAQEHSKKNTNVTDEAVEKIRKEVTDQFGELDERLEFIINKLDAVDRAAEFTASNRKDAFDREVEMLKRIQGLEEGMNDFRDKMRLLGRKVDDGSVELVQAQVQSLVQKAKDARDDREKVKETVAMLEAAVEAMKKENDKLDVHIREVREDIAAKAIEAAMALQASRPAPDTVPVTTPNVIRRPNVAQTKEAPADQGFSDAMEAEGDFVDGKLPIKFQEQGGDISTAATTTTNPPRRRARATTKHRKHFANTDEEPVKKARKNQRMTRRTQGKAASTDHHKSRIYEANVSRKEAILSKSIKRELAGLLPDVQTMGPERPATRKLATDTQTQMPIVRSGKGWVEVIEPVSDNEEEENTELSEPVLPSNAAYSPAQKSSTGFAGNPIHVKRVRGCPRKIATPAHTYVQEQAQPLQRVLGHSRKPARQSSVQRAVEQPEPPVLKRRTIAQNDNTEGRTTFCSALRGKKRKADADAIDERMDLLAPRATRTQRGMLAPVPAKRAKHDAQSTVDAATRPRASIPSASVGGRRGLTNIFSSPISSPPGTSVSGSGTDELKAPVGSGDVAKDPLASSRRRIQQFDYGSELRERSEQLTRAQVVRFDKDFEM